MRAFAEPVNSDSLPVVDLGHVAPNGRSIHGAGAFCDDRACITSAVAKLPIRANDAINGIEGLNCLPKFSLTSRRGRIPSLTRR